MLFNHAMLHVKVVGQAVETRVSMPGNVSWVSKAGIHGHSLGVHVWTMRTKRYGGTVELLPWVVHAPYVSFMDVLLALRQAVEVRGAIGPVMGERWSCWLVVFML